MLSAERSYLAVVQALLAKGAEVNTSWAQIHHETITKMKRAS